MTDYIAEYKMARRPQRANPRLVLRTGVAERGRSAPSLRGGASASSWSSRARWHRVSRGRLRSVGGECPGVGVVTWAVR